MKNQQHLTSALNKSFEPHYISTLMMTMSP